MLTSILGDYSDAYILVKGTILISNSAVQGADNANEMVILKNCAPFFNCTSRISNAQCRLCS